MDPVPRPEWASPLEVGVHVRSFYTALPEQPTRKVLEALCNDAPLLAFLERYPLGKLEFSGRLPNPEWRGSYDPQFREVVVNPMSLSFPNSEDRHKLWGGPPGPQPAPWPACRRCRRLSPHAKSGTRASRADQGVRPTTYAEPSFAKAKWH